MVLDAVYNALEAFVGRDLPARKVKRKLKTWIRGGAFLVLTVVFVVYNTVHASIERYHGEHNWDQHPQRLLEGGCVEPANPSGLCFPYAIGCCYLLLALAVVADEYFVPALTIIGEYLELSEDVTGATLMAMGGSAPELFTNAAGTFARSDVGFGAIVGSAVFNLLFVIGIVAAIAKKPLQLTWYPLTRDSMFYMVVLISLAIFFGVTSPGVMELWESLILHIEYWLYVLLMRYSARIQQYFDKPSDANTLSSALNPVCVSDASVRRQSIADGAPLLNPKFGFRGGVMSMIVNNKTASQCVELALVGKLVGSVNEAFDSVDTDRSGDINLAEMTAAMARLGLDATPEGVRTVFAAIDTDRNGTVSREEFSVWFKKSRQMVEMEISVVFKALDKDKSGCLDKAEIGLMLETLGGGWTASGPSSGSGSGMAASEAELEACFREMQGGKDGGEVTQGQFLQWYFNEENEKGYLGKAKTADKIPSAVGEGDKEEEEEEEGLSIFPGDKKGYAFMWYIIMLPMALSFTYTIPNVKQETMKSVRWALVAFASCLAWMGLICYFNVAWIEIIGATAGIPSVIMGLTFLAAGTSVPDMLGAIIVAKRGQGDMAVSSSVGSNVFDICVGLALPWILFYAVYGEAYTVGADSLFVSIVIIVVSVFLVIISLKINKWLHTKTTGWLFMAGYGAFVAQQLARVDWSNPGC